MPYHYVYEIIEKSSGKRYIGSRTSVLLPENDLGIVYFSSTTDLNFYKRQLSKPDDYEYVILSVYATRIEANAEERRLHELYKVNANDNFYNKVITAINAFNPSGMVVVKDKIGNIYHVSLDDERYLSGELVHISKGKITVIDKDGNTSSVGKDDPRYLSGELVGFSKGRVNVRWKDKMDEPGFMVDVDDPRYLSGELVSANKGFKFSKEQKKKVSVALKGRKKSKEHIEKVASAQRGKERPKYARYRVLIDDILYDSITLAYRATGLLSSEIYKRGMDENDPVQLFLIEKEIHLKIDNWVMVDGIEMRIQEASQMYRLSKRRVTYRCDSTSKKWENWYFTKRTMLEHK